MPERVEVMLSVQRALLGAITPNVRRVEVYWDTSEIRLLFVIDSGTQAIVDEVRSVVEAEVHADFLPPVTTVESLVIEEGDDGTVPMRPVGLGNHGVAFARYEG